MYNNVSTNDLQYFRTPILLTIANEIMAFFKLKTLLLWYLYYI